MKETILLFGLSAAEKRLISRLVASFAIDVVNSAINTIRSFVTENPDKQICLVVYRVNEKHLHQERIIRLIRDFVGDITPILLLVPQSRLADIRNLLNGGADDFLELPVNSERFSISFLILLEMGQATFRTTSSPKKDGEQQTVRQRAGWQRIIGYFQNGLSYFAPRSLLTPPLSESFSTRWIPIRKLGEGGFGKVWLIKEKLSGRLAVAKTPHSHRLNIRVLRSAAILKRLVHHPNIVELYEVIKDQGRFILIQEYVEGKTVQELLAEGRMTAKEREQCFLQLLSVIAHAHKHRILHRDIKPENIMISNTGQLKLLDFGIARDLTWQSPHARSEGTVNFMPPEQIKGHCTIASDVWALGVVLYIFATNAVPYFQHNGQEVVDQLLCSVPHAINTSIDRELESIIVRCLKTSPDQRYPDGASLLSHILSILPNFGRGDLLLS